MSEPSAGDPIDDVAGDDDLGDDDLGDDDLGDDDLGDDEDFEDDLDEDEEDDDDDLDEDQDDEDELDEGTGSVVLAGTDGDGYEPGDVNTIGGARYEVGDVNTMVGAQPEGTGPRAATVAGGEAPLEVLTYLARSLADDPEAVVIRREDRRGSVILRLHVAPGDMGRIIGRRGRTAQAIRTLVGAAGARDGVQTLVDIVDD